MSISSEQVEFKEIPRTAIQRIRPSNTLLSIIGLKYDDQFLLEDHIFTRNDPTRISVETIKALEDKIDDLARLGVATLKDSRRPINYLINDKVEGRATLTLPGDDPQTLYAHVNINHKDLKESFQAQFVGVAVYQEVRMWYRESLSSQRGMKFYPHDAIWYEFELVGYDKAKEQTQLADYFPPLGGGELTGVAPKSVQKYTSDKITAVKTPLGNISDQAVQEFIDRINQASANRRQLFY